MYVSLFSMKMNLIIFLIKGHNIIEYLNSAKRRKEQCFFKKSIALNYIMQNNKQEEERILLVGVNQNLKDDINDTTEDTLEELKELCKTAGGKVIDYVIQKRQSLDPATYIGEGKIEEIKQICANKEIDLIVFDNELNGIQLRNLEKSIGVRIIDRSMLILDIFSKHADTAEGKIQVKLAQLKYMLPRISELSQGISRAGVGVSARGPGETKSEISKRYISQRIKVLSNQLKEIDKNRQIKRRSRKKSEILQIALVGYTNAGKSSLLNALTEEQAIEENKLFSTLDTRSVRLDLPNGTKSVIIDTVGFIRKLPHHLIKAFHSTLEESMDADILLHVIDISSKEYKSHMKVVEEIISGFHNVKSNKIIKVYNKIDKLPTFSPLPNDGVCISAVNKIGIDTLISNIINVNFENKVQVKLKIPQSEYKLISDLYANENIIKKQFTEDYIYVTAEINRKNITKYEKYM